MNDSEPFADTTSSPKIDSSPEIGGSFTPKPALPDLTRPDATGPDLTGKRVAVLDVHGILYQVFHSMRDMSGPNGQPTGAAFGFVRDVMNLMLKLPLDRIFCAFDLPGPTFRHAIYPEYKANRPAMPDDLRPQTIFVRRLLDALCVSRLESPGYEADDILATVARRAESLGAETVLVTSDKDARQLITPHVKLHSLRKEADYTAAELLADWGIAPWQVVDFQTMVGDASDNVPGVPLIGPKTATELLQKYKTLEEIFSHLSELTPKRRENFEKSREWTATARRLVTLDADVPIEIDWDAGAMRGIDATRLREIFRELGFRSLMPQIERLVERFGTSESVVSESPDSAVAHVSTAKNGHQIDSAGFRSAQPTEPDETEIFALSREKEDSLASENRSVAEKLFDVISAPREVYFPVIDIAADRPFDTKKITYHTVETMEQFDRFLSLLRAASVISFDLETVDSQGGNRVRPRWGQIVGMSFCFDAHNGWYLPIRGPLGSLLLPEPFVLDGLRPILESPHVLKMGQNIKFDAIVLANVGVRLRGIFFDTMVADYLLHSGEQRHNLDELAERYLGHETMKISELIGTGKKQKRMDEVPVESVAHYAGEDAMVPCFLYPRLLAELQKQPDLLRLLAGLEIPLIDVLIEMESNGIAVNASQFATLGGLFAEKLLALEKEIRALCEEAKVDPIFAATFNLNSPQQLARLLFDDLKLPSIKKTKTGRSTDYEVLEHLAEDYPVAAKLIEHRTAAKLKGTYIDPIPELIHPQTGRIHASFNQVVTATGRLSASDPNLQNIPVRTEEGKLIRRGFVPDQTLGFDTLLAADYSQVELRVLTHFSRDENLLCAFAEERDIHAHVASELFDVPITEVDSDKRRIAKTVNFGLVYGQSAFGLAKMLAIPQNEAAEYIRKFFATYPGIHAFLDRVLEECRRNGYVETLLGRRRRIEGVRGARGAAQLNMPERTAINTVIQGSAADIMKLAMVKVHRAVERLNEEKNIPNISTLKQANPPVVLPPTPRERTLFDHELEVAPTPVAPPQIALPETAQLKSEQAVFSPPRLGPRANLLLQIHDELILETTADFAPELQKIVVREMELGQPLAVPLRIDTVLGPTWGDE